MPRSISQREHWKANEFKTFMLYYAIVCLKDILPGKYLKHLFLLVWCIHMMLQRTVNRAKVEKVKLVLKCFIQRMEDLYELQGCTFNVHQLSHIGNSVDMCGPLWSTSTFEFESNNRMFGKFFHGTQHGLTQISKHFVLSKTLPLYYYQCQPENVVIDSLMKQWIFGDAHNVRNHIELCEGTHVFGTPKCKQIDASQTIALREALQSNVNPVVVEYCRFTTNGTLYDTTQYKRSTTRQNKYAKVKLPLSGDIVHVCLTSLVEERLCNCDISRTGVWPWQTCNAHC